MASSPGIPGGGGQVIQEGLQHRGHEVERGDGLFRDESRQIIGVLVASRFGQGQLGAGDQRPEKFPDRNVETAGSFLEDIVVRPEHIGVLHPHQPVEDSPVGVHRALRTAGGTGGVDHVGEVVRTAPTGSRIVGGRGTGGAVAHREAVQPDDFGGARQPVRQFPVAEEERDFGILQHEAQTFGGIVGIQRNVGAAGLEDGQQADHQFDRPLQTDADERVRRHSLGDELVGQPVGVPIEIAVAERDPRSVPWQHHGGTIGGRGHLGLEQIDDGPVGRVGDEGLVPSAKLVAVLRAQQREPGDRLLRLPQRRGQQPLEVLAHPFDRRRAEEVTAVFPAAEEPAVFFHDPQAEVELRGLRFGRERGHAQIRPAGELRAGLPAALVDEHHLEERRMAQAPHRLELLEQVFEGQLLMIESLQDGLFHRPEERGEAPLRIDRGAQDEGVGEKSDQRLGLPVGPVGDRRTDQQVRLAAVAVEQELEDGQQGDEFGDLVLPGKRPQVGAQASR
jgi:hypothetical protein